MENQPVKMQSYQIADYINIMQEQGKSFEEIKIELLAKGVSEDEILAAKDQKVIGYPAASHASKVNSTAGHRKMLIGGLFFVGGAAVTFFTYSNASSNGGGSYLIVYGPMIYGAITFISGLYESAQS